MQHRTYPGLLIILLSSLFSCQSNTSDASKASAKTVYADYFIRYMAEGNELKATASFQEGDTITHVSPLKLKGGVTFHGSGMVLKNIQDKVYRYTQARVADYAEVFSFRHQYQGETLVYEIKMNPIKDFYVKGSASGSNGLDVVVVDQPLEKGESYVFLLSDQNNKAVSFTVRGPGNKLENQFPAEEIAKLEAGKGELYIVKKQTRFERQGKRDIRAEIEYYTMPLMVDIE